MQNVDGVLVATTLDPRDDAIEQLCHERGWACRRGADEDVLDRIVRAARSVEADHVLRVDGDQPLFDWHEADRLVETHLAEHADLTHNLPERGSGMPLGTGAEIARTAALEVAWSEARSPEHRTHATAVLHAHPERFHVLLRRAPPELARPAYRFTVDLLEDLERVRRIQRVLGERVCVELARAVALIDHDAASRGVAM
jgi:spore coat polysaccharide biosynthesis protein SpsF